MFLLLDNEAWRNPSIFHVISGESGCPSLSAITGLDSSCWRWHRRADTCSCGLSSEDVMCPSTCQCRWGIDKESAINDYTIREEALKGNTFQFGSRKPSELVTNWKHLWSNGKPLNWGWDDSDSVSNSFYVAALLLSVARSFRRAAAYLIYVQSRTFQVLIEMQAEWQWEFMAVRLETVLSEQDWYLWKKNKIKRLSRSNCQHAPLSFLCSFFPMSQHLDTFGMERGEEALFHPSHPTVPQGALGWFVILCLTW